MYRSYRFVDKDPIMDELKTLRADADMGYDKTEKSGGPSAGTIRNWELGGVRRPQFATVSAAAITWGATGVEFRGGRPHFVTRRRAR